MKSKAYKQVLDLLEELRGSTLTFFENELNQTESTILEYKTSFEYDTALSLCPHTTKKKEALLNDALSLRILETIVAFANTNGGLLILGVAERKGQIVDPGQIFRCGKTDCQTPCFLEVETLPACDIKNLRIFGINRELELTGKDIDQFKRKILERFSLAGKNARRGISFKQAAYPCDGERSKQPFFVSPSASPDSLITDIFHIDHVKEGINYRLCVIQVAPSREPVTLNVCENGSHTVKSVFPFRQPGKTCLEEDFQRIWNYIQKRFRPSLEEDFYERIAKLFDDKLKGAVAANSDQQSLAWRSFQVDGCTFEIDSGIASTLQNPNGCTSTWFSGDTTVILGSGELDEESAETRTSGGWKIQVDAECLENCTMGYLVIGCLRFFGGLHSANRGSQVEVIFNGKYIDGFSLMVMPPEHSDYFHRIPKPKLPDLWPLSACQTVYAWPIQKTSLALDCAQTVTVAIDKDVSWDVDYVAIICH